MQKIKIIFSIPDSYIHKIEKNTKIDAAMAMGLFFIFYSDTFIRAGNEVAR